MKQDRFDPPWFHLQPLPAAGAVVDLDADEARHATAARRLGPAAKIVLFDGEGGVAHAELVEMGGRRLRARLLERTTFPQPRPLLHLASALPKGDRQATLLGMATQLGMSSFTPLHCERSVVQPAAGQSERWLRLLREACKQSRRAHLPALCAAASPSDVAALPDADSPLLLLHPEGAPLAQQLIAFAARELAGVRLLIGPEGGFTDAELDAVHAHAGQIVSLGSAILRTETAAVAALAVCSALLTAGGRSGRREAAGAA